MSGFGKAAESFAKVSGRANGPYILRKAVQAIGTVERITGTPGLDGVLPAFVQRVVSVQARDDLSGTGPPWRVSSVMLLELVSGHDLQVGA